MRHLSNKEKKELQKLLWEGYNILKKDEIVEDKNIIYKNSEKYLIIFESTKKEIKKVIPHLRNLVEKGFSSVYIDSGAIPFLIKGADMMRPGIQEIEQFKKDDIILIREEEHKKTLAIGLALYDSEEMKKMEKGISVKVLHYMGDEKF